MPGVGPAEGGAECVERKEKPDHGHLRPRGGRRRGRESSPEPFSSDLRRSFGSDHDALPPHLTFLHLAGRERCGGPGLGPDPEKRAAFASPDATVHNPPSPTPKEPEEEGEELVQPEEEEEEQEEEEEEEEEEGGGGGGGEGGERLDPAKHSFSRALRECQTRRIRSEAHPVLGRRHQRRRPASLDLNVQGADAAVLSPRFVAGGAGGGMRRGSAASSRSRSGTFPSPGTPHYRYSAGVVAGYQKGWSSERVPLPTNGCRRGAGSSVLLPLGNGRALPSKWEDAEKWIFSPVSADGLSRPSMAPPHHRRPKSKSGPLGAPTGIGVSSSTASPLVPCFDSGRVNFTAGSPFLAGVLVADRGCCGNGNNRRGGGGGGGGDVGGRSYSANSDPYIVRSASVHGWSDMLIESSSSLPSSQGTTQDEKIGNTREVAAVISPVVLKKDMATQMSPEHSPHSSPSQRPSLTPSPPSAHPIAELESHFSKLEVRDVPVDDRVTMTRWSKKHVVRGSDKRSTNIIQWKKKTMESRSCSWEVTDTTKCMSKYRREEAKITAWENLQKAKAEAAIRKLEMKLEKKRSSSMDKILNKLRSAQRKAQEMRNVASASQAHQVARSTRKASYFRRTGQISSLSGCFTCHAF